MDCRQDKRETWCTTATKPDFEPLQLLTFRGCFILLGFGCLMAVVAVVGEKVISWSTFAGRVNKWMQKMASFLYF